MTSRPSLDQQADALRHAISICSRDGNMGEPALSWLRAAAGTIAFLRENQNFARALIVVLDAVSAFGEPIARVYNTENGSDK